MDRKLPKKCAKCGLSTHVADATECLLCHEPFSPDSISGNSDATVKPRLCPVCGMTTHGALVDVCLVCQNPLPAQAEIPSETDPSFSTPGVWRDGRLLVIRNRNAQIPMRCIKTNQPVSGLTRLDLVWIQDRALWVALLVALGLIGHLIAKSTFMKTIPVQLPLSQKWHSRHVRIGRIGRVVIAGGVWVFLIGALACVLAMFWGVSESFSQAAILFLLLMPLVVIMTAIFMLAFHRPIAVVRKLNRDHTWIGGADSQFLDSLPEWSGDPPVNRAKSQLP